MELAQTIQGLTWAHEEKVEDDPGFSFLAQSSIPFVPALGSWPLLPFPPNYLWHLSSPIPGFLWYLLTPQADVTLQIRDQQASVQSSSLRPRKEKEKKTEQDKEAGCKVSPECPVREKSPPSSLRHEHKGSYTMAWHSSCRHSLFSSWFQVLGDRL